MTCQRPPRGWRCYLDADHGGPCPAWPSLWNVKWRWKMRGVPIRTGFWGSH